MSKSSLPAHRRPVTAAPDFGCTAPVHYRPWSRLGLLTVACLAGFPIQAADGVWQSTTSPANWGTPGNWIGGIPASGSGATADFATINPAADVTVVLESAYTAGRLNFGDTDTSSAAGWIIGNGGTAANSLTLATITGTPVIDVTALGTGKTASITAVLTGTQGLTKTGAGTLVLSNASTLTGPVSVTGTLSGGGGALPVGSYTLNNGTVALAGNAQTFAQAVTASGTNGFAYANGSNFFNAPSVAGSGQLNFTLGGNTGAALTFNAANGFGAFAGTINLGTNRTYRFDSTYGSGDAAAGSAAAFNLISGASLSYRNGTNGMRSYQLGALSGDAGSFLSGGGTAGSGFIEYRVGARNSSSTFYGTIQDGLTKTRLTKTGTATLTLAGTSTYTGVTDVLSGTLAIAGTGSLTATSAINVASGATLQVDGTVASGVVTTIASGGTLQGVGSLGTTSVAGSFRPGNSAGTQTFTGDLTLQAGSGSYFEFNLAAFPAGSYDLASGSSRSVAFGGTLNLAFAPSESWLDGTGVTIFDFATNSGTFSSVTFSGLAPGQSAGFDAATGQVFLTSVPEPGAAGLLLASLGLMARRRR